MAQWMWIVASPNGAGKSSFAGRFLRDLGHRHLIKLNADERTLELRKKFPDAAENDLQKKCSPASPPAERRAIYANPMTGDPMSAGKSSRNDR